MLRSTGELPIAGQSGGARVEGGRKTETRPDPNKNANGPMTDHSHHFSPDRFWTKLRDHALAIGRDLVYSALVLYYTLQDPDTPPWARSKIYGALGYLIFPVDAVPDWWPAGYVDDAAVIAAALGAVAMHIGPDAKQAARAKMRDWFGDRASGAALVT